MSAITEMIAIEMSAENLGLRIGFVRGGRTIFGDKVFLERPWGPLLWPGSNRIPTDVQVVSDHLGFIALSVSFHFS